MIELEYELIRNGLIGVIQKPGAFFKEIFRKEVNMAVPIVIFLIAGILGSIAIHSTLPTLEPDAKTTMTPLAQKNLENQRKVVTVQTFFFPLWLLLFWAIYTICLSIGISAFGGFGDFVGMFNCTSFMSYFYLIYSAVRLAFVFIPGLNPLVYVAGGLLGLWFLFLTFKIVTDAGEVDKMNAGVLIFIHGLFMSLLWFSYEYIIRMIVIPSGGG